MTDKYRREDDMNDDLGVYRGEDWASLTVVNSKGTGEQLIKVIGKTKPELLLLERLNKATGKLSKREKEVLELVCYKGYSIRKAAKRLKIAQQTAQEYWNNVRKKMKND